MKSAGCIRYPTSIILAAWLICPGAGVAQQTVSDPSPPAVLSQIMTPDPEDLDEAAPAVPSTLAPPDDHMIQPDGGAIAESGPATAGPTPVLAPDLSPWSMFKAAHWVVKAVMLSLAFACFVTWTVLLFKVVELAIARRRARRSGREIRDAQSLAAASLALSGRRDPAAFMAQAALAEYRRSDEALDSAGPDGVKERVRSILDRVDAQAIARMRRGTGLLASIGATAPFVGLFGTVWGIMNSFIGIAASKTTNLAVVAPGIAEALLATAIGLVAAIPAVVIYNFFSREIGTYRLMLGDAAAGVERLVSRDLDFRKIDRKAA